MYTLHDVIIKITVYVVMLIKGLSIVLFSSWNKTKLVNDIVVFLFLFASTIDTIMYQNGCEMAL